MENTSDLPANEMAERIVRHFQCEGFTGISEALVVRIGLRKGEQSEVDAAFASAADRQKMPPVGEYFEIRPYGHFPISAASTKREPRSSPISPLACARLFHRYSLDRHRW